MNSLAKQIARRSEIVEYVYSAASEHFVPRLVNSEREWGQRKK